MNTIGEVLRNARETKGVGLSKAEDDTKIRRKYLQALEDGKYDVLPGRVYTKGFLRIYAKYLGLDDVQILNDYSQSMLPQVASTKPTASKVKKTRPRTVKGDKRSAYILTFATVCIALLILAAYGYFFSKNTPQSTNVGDKPKTAAKPNAGQVDNGQTAPQNQGDKGVTPPAPKTENPISQPPADSKVELKLVGTSGVCWTKVIVDGTAAFQGNIYSGDTKVFSGETIRLTLGNAGAVEVFQNGLSLGYLGSNGNVVNREFKVE